jgi:hypothetical protein
LESSGVDVVVDDLDEYGASSESATDAGGSGGD